MIQELIRASLSIATLTAAFSVAAIAQMSMPMPSIAPLFMEDQQRTSVITMVNDAPTSLDLDVVLKDLSGAQLIKQAISLEPHSQQTVPIATLLPSSTNHYGSVLLMPHRPTTMAAQLSITNRDGAEGGNIEEEFTMLMSPNPATYRAVSVASGSLVAITSLSPEAQTVRVDCLHKTHEGTTSFTIQPNQTLLVDACGKRKPASLLAVPDIAADPAGSPQPVAIAVSSQAPSMDLAVFGVGLLPSATQPRYVAIPFADMSTVKSSTTAYPGAFGAEISWRGIRTALANFGETGQSVTVSLSQGSEAGMRKTLATLNLAPKQVILLDSLSHLNGLRSDATLVIQSDGAPGQILSGVQAWQNPASDAVALPWKDAAQTPNGGQHPWRTDLGTTSSLVLYNPDEVQQASLPVTIYSNGHTWTKNITVGPLATVAISINDVVDGRTADDHGHTLEPGGTHGMVSWYTLAKPKLLGMVRQSSSLTGIVRPFACAQTYALCALSIPNETVGVGDTTGNFWPSTSTCGTNGDCSCVESCNPSGVSLSSYSWSSANSAIASLVSSSTSAFGDFQGVSSGSTYSDLSAYDNLGCSASGSGSVNVCGLSISPGQFNVSCDNSSNDKLYSVTTDPSASCIMSGTPSCSASFSGNVEEDTGHSPNPSCNVVAGIWQGHVYMFAGPAQNPPNQTAGSASISVTVNVNGTAISKSSTIPVICQ
jgi:hypothetical protein